MNKVIISVVASFALSATLYATETPASNTSRTDLLNVHNRCIVSLKESIDVSEVRGIAKAMAVKGNADIQYIYENSIRGFTINIPCHAASIAFGDNADIDSMTPDSIITINKGKPVRQVTPPPAQTVPYGTSRVGGGAEDGTGHTAWVIDTGIDLTHPDLNVDASRGFSVFKRGKRVIMNDENGHGTHVAGTIGAIDNAQGSLGVAPNTTMVPVRVLDRQGSGTTSGVIAGIDFVAANANAGDCVNMSLGGGVSSVLDAAVYNASENSRAYFVLAAGNEGDDANNHSPSRVNGEYIWTISAVDNNDVMPSWSNVGNPPVDYAAPGVGIFSLWLDGGTRTISGTSMASPHACAVIMMTNGSPSSDGEASGDRDGNPDSIIHF
ncbi:MAG: S8 family serine peptidase [Campylobacterota bacterium]